MNQRIPRRLILDKPTRDAIAIFEPRLAPLLRRVALAAAVVRWCVAGPPRYTLVLPQGWAERTLGAGGDDAGAVWRRLADYAPPLAAAIGEDGLAWALGRGAAATDMAGAVWSLRRRGLSVATIPVGWVVGPGLGSLPGAQGWQVAALNSAYVAGQVDAHSPTGVRWMRRVRLPELDEPTRAALTRLGALAADLTGERLDIEREVGQRLLRDYGPPGAALSPALRRWWALSFAALLAEMARTMRGEVPQRYREPLEQWLAERGAARRALIERLDGVQALLDATVVE